MDPNMLSAMRNIAATAKTSFPWAKDTKHSQPYFTCRGQNAWLPSSSFSAPSQSEVFTIEKLTLITWNIDFMLPLPSERLSAALSHLESLLFSVSAPKSPPTTPTLIFLQEMLVSDLHLLQSTPWIQQHFYLTDIDSSNWESGYYGTCTLIDKRLPISDVFRVHYSATAMERDGLFVDIVSANTDKKLLRFCNTHLESLIADPPLRPAQVATAAQHMRSEDVHASALAGDLNAIQPFDRTLHADNGLRDAYLELGGDENSARGHTWGQQAQTKLRDMFGTSRMDKVFLWGGLRVDRLEQIGVDVEVESEGDREVLKMQGLEKGWVTDHLGLMADLVVSDAAVVDDGKESAPRL